jgi:CcmD family protein
MSSLEYLYAAYIATWVIHGLYIGSLVGRYNTLKQRMKELGKTSQ